MLWARRAFTAGVGLVVAGYASSFASVGQCQVTAAYAVAHELERRDVFVLPANPSSTEDYPESEAILRSAGFTVRQCPMSTDRFDCFSWAGVARAEVVGPFLVDVRWGYVAAPTSGRGTRTRHIAIFGAVFPVFDAGGWVT